MVTLVGDSLHPNQPLKREFNFHHSFSIQNKVKPHLPSTTLITRLGLNQEKDPRVIIYAIGYEGIKLLRISQNLAVPRDYFHHKGGDIDKCTYLAIKSTSLVKFFQLIHKFKVLELLCNILLWLQFWRLKMNQYLNRGLKMSQYLSSHILFLNHLSLLINQVWRSPVAKGFSR